MKDPHFAPPALSLDDKARLTAGRNLFGTEDLPALGLRALKLADGPIGVTSGRVDERDVSLLMPSGVALAATWDRELVRQIGCLIGDEARRRAVHVVLGPNLNLPRSPLFGRAFETFSEDPWLTGTLGACWIAGVQSRGVGAAAKHVVGNDSETQRHAMNAVIDERALREVALLPFELAARAGVWAFLMAYNKLNGVPNVEQRDVIRILKEEWGWDGLVISDWFATHDTARSANAGLDLEMPGPPRHFGPKLAGAVRAGQVSETRLDDAVARFVKLAGRVGQLGASVAAPEPITEPRALLRHAAAAGFVLLKNDRGLLPATIRSRDHIAVIGPNALLPSYQGATFAKIALGPEVRTPLAALREKFHGVCPVVYEPGVPSDYRLPPITLQQVRAGVEGPPGLTLDYYADHDTATTAASEVRNASTVVWFGDMPGGCATTRAGRVHASTIFTPAADGAHTFYFGGTGDVTISIDGQPMGARPSPVVGGDVMGHLLRGDSDSIACAARAGVPLRLDYEMRFAAARAQGIWFGILAPEPAGHMDRAAQAAAGASLVVLVVGETAESGVESRDRATTRLPDNQIALIERVCAANPNTVVVVNAAHAVDMAWADQAGCILQVWFPGEEFGPALAAVLTGALEPSGRLPVTFARDERDYPVFDLTPDASLDLRYHEGAAIGYRHFDAHDVAPRFPLGHGLGYADFEYSDLRIEPFEENALHVSLTVRNISRRAGREVVQLYVAGPAVAYAELKGFESLTLAPGKARRVTLSLDRRAFAHWSPDARAWQIQAGDYEIMVGRSFGDIRLHSQVMMTAG